jgi:transcriptional regulator with XRE-family HTH domain
MKRTKSWNQEVSERLRKSPKAVAAYLSGLCEADDELSLEEALKLTVLALGLKEFCEMADATQSNVSAFVNGKRKLSADVLNNLLKPFGLKAELVLRKAS